MAPDIMCFDSLTGDDNYLILVDGSAQQAFGGKRSGNRQCFIKNATQENNTGTTKVGDKVTKRWIKLEFTMFTA